MAWYLAIALRYPVPCYTPPMRHALLTIDDSPGSLTPAILDHLATQDIRAVFFCIGEHLEAFPDQADLIVRAGHTLGNHSWSHPAFSGLTLADSITQIDRTEAAIDHVHSRTGIPRTHRVFRFPYGDKGGPLKDLLQAELARRSFQNPAALFPGNGHNTSHAPGLSITYPWYADTHLSTDLDWFWTFDTLDYRLTDSTVPLTLGDLLAHIADPAPAQGGSLSTGTSDHLVLMHDHPATHGLIPHYYRTLIGAIQATGTTFLPR